MPQGPPARVFKTTWRGTAETKASIKARIEYNNGARTMNDRELDKELQEQSDKDQQIDDKVELLMGGDDPDLLAEVLAESPHCVATLATLCECSSWPPFDSMRISDVRVLVARSQNLIDEIEARVKEGVEAGHYP